MSANPLPSTPLEPPRPPDAHDRRIGTIAAWLKEKAETDLVVEVLTGTNRVQVARGRFVRMEAHPTAEGVHRLVFDNAQGGLDVPPGEQWISVGHELVDVAAGDASLIIDKGSQRVEVHVVGAGAQEPPPAAYVAAAPIEPTAPTTGADVSIIEAYAPGLEAVANAPLYQNSAVGASRLFGETRLEVAHDELHVTARRMRHGTAFFVMLGVVLAAFVPAGLMLYAVVVLGMRSGGTTGFGDVEYLDTFRYGIAGLVGAALLAYVIGRFISSGAAEETIVAPLADVSASHYRRVSVLRGPFGRKERRRKLILKPAGKADRARLSEVVDAIRARRDR